MSITTINVSIGGLCMFVQRTKGPPEGTGVFVLMPDQKTSGAEHYPMLRCDPRYVQGSQPSAKLVRTLLYEHSVIDFRQYGRAQAQTELDDHVAKVSRFAKATVNPRWIDETSDCLAARIAFPLGTSITPDHSNMAKMFVIVDLKKQDVDVVGQATVEMPVAVSDLSSIEIAGLTLVPDVNGALKFELINVPIADTVESPPKETHHVGEINHHFQAYYWLHEDRCRSHKGGPQLRVREADNGRPFVDPYKCTLGDGCLQGENC